MVLSIAACVWGAVAIALFVYVTVSSWLWARRNPPDDDEPTVREVHDGSGCIPGFMACMIWPLMLPTAIYEKWRYPP